MKIKYWYIYWVIASTAFLTACETPISMELPEKAGTTVIEGWIENNTPAMVAVSRSMSYYSTIDINTIFSSVDTAAIVIITDDAGNSETLRLGISIDHIFGIVGRVYVGRTLKGVPGRTYNLYVKTSDGNEYTAQTYIPENTVNIDSMVFQINNPVTDTILPIRTYIKDNPNTYDCYRFFINISNLKINWSPFLLGLKYYFSPASFGSFDDLTFNGQNVVFDLARTPATNLSFMDMSQEERREYWRWYFKEGDTIYVRSTLTDIYTYKYWFSVQLDLEGGSFNSLVVPGHYKTNLIGKDVTGIWSGYHARYDTITFPKR